MPWVQVKGITDAGLKPRKLKKIAVLGGGLMGSGIATASALAGMDVLIKEVNDKFLQVRPLLHVAGWPHREVVRKACPREPDERNIHGTQKRLSAARLSAVTSAYKGKGLFRLLSLRCHSIVLR